MKWFTSSQFCSEGRSTSRTHPSTSAHEVLEAPPHFKQRHSQDVGKRTRDSSHHPSSLTVAEISKLSDNIYKLSDGKEWSVHLRAQGCDNCTDPDSKGESSRTRRGELVLRRNAQLPWAKSHCQRTHYLFRAKSFLRLFMDRKRATHCGQGHWQKPLGPDWLVWDLHKEILQKKKEEYSERRQCLEEERYIPKAVPSFFTF